MVQKINSFERFWKELKRRRTIRVITVYAAASFIILQLVDIIGKPLQLPEWTLTFVIVLLCVGFIIATLLSWIYDITPTGVKKTKPVGTVNQTNTTTNTTSGGWKIATYVSGAIIVALIAFNFIVKRNLNSDILNFEKSIAVLPFINDSPSDSNQYFINGIMEEVLDNLQIIKEFRVLSRTSTDQYKDLDRPTIPEIAKKLNVNFVIEGSGQKYGNKFILRVQLISANNERHLWAKSYEQEIHTTSDFISIQSEIARSIATELKAMITPEEKQQIEKTPTDNLTAYDFYLRGRDEHTKYWIDNNNKQALERADDLYHEALKYDSTFAQAYAGLAKIYWDQHFWASYLSIDFLDSVLIFSDLAIKFDDRLSEAYTIRGDCFREKEKPEKAIDEYNNAIRFNPNDAMAYWGKGLTYVDDDRIKTIDNFQKAISLYRGSLLPGMLREIGFIYGETGFREKEYEYYQEAFNLDRDSLENYKFLTSLDFHFENYESIPRYLERIYAIDSNNVESIWYLGELNEYLSKFKESIKYFKIWLRKNKTLSGESLFGMHRIGLAFWQNGSREEAKYFFNKQIEYCNKMKELGRVYGENARIYYDLAGVDAFMGKNEKALRNLRMYINQKQIITLWVVSSIKHDPLFNSIRNEPEFQQIVRDVEAKYQTEHERVKKWLEETGQL